MSRKKRTDQAWHRARQAAAQMKPVAAQVKPLAKSTAVAAKRRVRRTRAWAAPKAERTGRVLQDSLAPKVSALLSSAAQRLEPGKPRNRRWRKRIGIATMAAAASTAAAFVRNRRKAGFTTSAAKADDVVPAAEMGNGQASATSSDGGVKGQVRTS
jgi:hypothetical protein